MQPFASPRANSTSRHVVRPRPDRLLDYREYPVLYVDDEPENLRIFELTFRREFSIVTATSGEEGLALLNQEPIALVLSDHRMPGMTGTEFLSRVAELDDKTIRVMVTAYGDVETLQAAINSGSIYRYVPKPWTPEDVRATLRRGIEAYALDREREQLLRELALLNRVSRSITQELELDPLLDLVLDTLIDDLGYDAASILFFDAKQETLRVGRAAPREAALEGELADLCITVHDAPEFLRQLREGEAVTLRSEEALDYEGSVRRWMTEVAAAETFLCPLFGRRHVVGALAVDNRRGGAHLNADDRTLIEGLSTQAVIAIENARLVDDLRRTREQVRRVDRLGTLGTLAAGLAHEINNPLVSINTFLSMAPGKREEPDPEFWEDYHDLACREVERIRRLVETMRRLGRTGQRSVLREPVDTDSVIQEVMTLLAREAAAGAVTLLADCAPDSPTVMANRDQIHQLILNLVLNAIAATPEGGNVTVRTTGDPAGGLFLEVSDTGPGIGGEHLDQIFDPFFTTKGPDKGTGLGLMICHRIATDHGGVIEVRSDAGKGATFSLRLPPKLPID